MAANPPLASRLLPASLDRMLNAGSVAIVGASSDAGKIGGKPVALIRDNFAGRLVPINPNRSEILDLPARPHISALEVAPDLAIVAVAASAAEAAVEDCLAAGVGAITLFSAGFGEIDAAGLAAQRRIAERCAAGGVRLLGPNSLGFINFHSGLYATFSAALDNVWPRKGSVAIASQSGAVGTYIMALAAEAGLGFSHFVATGNEADIDVADCIEWFAADPATSVVVAYLEGCRDGGRLRQALAAARAAKKPVIAIKPGATEAGHAAVKSHTGMLAGSKQVFDAVLRAHGAWPAASIEEAVDLAYACGAGRLPRDSRTVIVTPSGGVGIMLADAAELAGLSLPALPDVAAAGIRELLPLASTGNPVDTTAQVSNDFRLYGRVIDIVASGTDAPILLIFMAHMGKTPAVTDLLKPMLREVAAKFPKRIMALITRAAPDFHAEMSDAGFLVFQDPTRAVAAVGALLHFARSFSREDEAPPPFPPVARALIEEAARSAARAGALLAGIGIAQLPVHVATTAGEALDAARIVGYPVALKIASPDIQHKTEVGGVRLGIDSATELREAWQAMMATVAERAPRARIAGATLSPMLAGGVETIIGTQNDPDFGPVVMFGLGGVMAEALKDVVFAPAPVDMDGARRMIASIRATKALDGWRGAPPVDKEALARAIVALSGLAAANSRDIESIEVNPFVALPSDGVALDALVQLRTAGQVADK